MIALVSLPLLLGLAQSLSNADLIARAKASLDHYNQIALSHALARPSLQPLTGAPARVRKHLDFVIVDFGHLQVNLTLSGEAKQIGSNGFLDATRTQAMQGVEKIPDADLKLIAERVIREFCVPPTAPYIIGQRGGEFTYFFSYQGYRVQSTLGRSLKLDQWSGALLALDSFVKPAFQANQAFMTPRFPKEYCYGQAMAAGASTAPLSLATIFMDDFAVCAPLFQTIPNNMTAIHLENAANNKMMLFYMLGVEGIKDGRPVFQDVFVDATTGKAVAVDTFPVETLYTNPLKLEADLGAALDAALITIDGSRTAIRGELTANAAKSPNLKRVPLLLNPSKTYATGDWDAKKKILWVAARAYRIGDTVTRGRLSKYSSPKPMRALKPKL